MRRLAAPFSSIALVIFVSLFTACGSSGSSGGNNSPTASSPNPPGSAGSGSSGSGSGSGSASGGGTGSAGSGSAGSGGSSGSGSGTSFVAYAYTGGQNEIRGYGVNADGSLTPVAGSPFPVSNPQFATTSIVTNGANLYATADAGTNLDIFSINNSNGSLALANTTSALAGDPNTNPQSSDFASGLALDHTGASLYVVVGHSDFDSGVNVFTVGSSSSAQQIQLLPGPALALPPPVFSPNNQFAYSSLCGPRVDGVFGYARASDGTLKNMNPGIAQPPTTSGEAFCPSTVAASAKGYLAIAWPHFDFASSSPGNETFLKTYTINSDGTLTAVSNSQVQTASSKANKTLLSFDPTGNLLAVAGDGGVQIYAVNSDGTLGATGSPQAAGAKFQSVAWDKSNHVFATTSNQLYVFNWNAGALGPASGSPYTGDQSLTVLPLR